MTAYVLTCLLLFHAPAPAPAPAPGPMNLPDAPGPDGVYARCGWQPAAARSVGEKHYVFRDGKPLADAMKLKGDGAADTATTLLAKQFNVKDIDWKKHMLITVAAGLRADADRLTITRVVQKDQTLTIYYTLTVDQPAPPGDKPLSPPTATGFGCPAETVLIPRYDGAIKIQREDDQPAPKKD
jgi:hypothetical protein